VGFGTEILFILVLGLLVLGPKRVHIMLGQVARAKTRFEKAGNDFKSQLSAELDALHEKRKPDDADEPTRDQSREVSPGSLISSAVSDSLEHFN
jgi:Sec-independent protein translocase protein TatA